ncbi:MAG: right-handed parallel beta-helix repeat-containing protein [Candidatus Marinimicrobia bacterium]|nr:right-handed parallel beta-helix repeat-containing protein [Candidatus Neomarinimicrobiota bacterium]
MHSNLAETLRRFPPTSRGLQWAGQTFARLIPLVTALLFANTINIPADQSTIQAGINASVNGDTVLVQPGTYIENINFNGKNIVVGSLILTTGDTSYISQTTIDGDSIGSVVTFSNGEDNAALLRGFRITNGNYDDGGGIYCRDFASPTLEDLYILGNIVTQDGGGLYCYNSSSPVLNNVTIVNNNAGSDGGGIFCSVSCDPILTNVTISNNTAVQKGGGILCWDSNPTLTNVTLTGNTVSDRGGGLYLYNTSPTFNNVLIIGNSAYNEGGGVFCRANSNLHLINSTISDNVASVNEGGGIFCEDNSNPIIFNSVLYNNSPQEICFSISNAPNSVTIAYSIVEDGEIGILTNNGTVNWLDGNVVTNPLFSDIDNNDYSLSIYSPCIGAGSASVQIGGTWYYAHATDIDGNPRPAPAGTNPDIGAYENQLAEPLHNSFIHVATTGNDTGSVGLETAPFASIQAGINYSTNSDTVLVHTGTYIENINFNGKNIVVGSLTGNFGVIRTPIPV